MGVRITSRAWCAAAAVAVGLLGTACSGSSSASGAGTSTGPSPSGVVVANLQQGAGGRNVFNPSAVSVGSGGKIVVSNSSVLQHTFTVAGTNIDVVNDPGQFQTVTISLDRGIYPFVCRFHQAQGMKGTLTVTS